MMKVTRNKTAHAPRPPRHRIAPLLNAQERLDQSLQHLLLDDEWDAADADDNVFPDRDFRTVDD